MSFQNTKNCFGYIHFFYKTSGDCLSFLWEFLPPIHGIRYFKIECVLGCFFGWVSGWFALFGILLTRTMFVKIHISTYVHRLRFPTIKPRTSAIFPSLCTIVLSYKGRKKFQPFAIWNLLKSTLLIPFYLHIGMFNE